MSDKDRKKKDGRDKNKDNQAMREAMGERHKDHKNAGPKRVSSEQRARGSRS